LDRPNIRWPLVSVVNIATSKVGYYWGHPLDYWFANNFMYEYSDNMPRKARIDAPGALHHIIVRGIERRKFFL